MNDYFAHVERDLRAAVRRHAHLPWYVRLRRRHSRALVVVLVGLVVAAPALAASGLLSSGSPVGPAVPPSPTANNGVAIPSSVRLLALRAPDPRGGPPWGMRLLTTTRGLLCVQVGRVAFGTIGALGRDGAFGNDGRFHPFSENYQAAAPCMTPDDRGNGFQNVAEYGTPASALLPGQQPGCRPPLPLPPQLPARAKQQIQPQGHAVHPRRVTCPTRDLRQIDYGLLGPDAISITYQVADGGLRTIPTTGPDGAYLVVLPNPGTSQNARDVSDRGFDAGDGLAARGIRVVTYRDGHSCRLPPPGVPGSLSVSCQPVGYVTPAGSLPSQSQVSAPVSAHLVIAKAYCAKDQIIAACSGHPRPGWTRIGSLGPHAALLVIRFTARVAITNGRSYYYIRSCNPAGARRIPRWFQRLSRRSFQCFYGGSGGPTESDYTAGTRITYTQSVPVRPAGVVRGDVSLVITTGPSQPEPSPAAPGQSIGRDVGHFTVRVP